ncbi:MAG TPA: UDP-N-acetylmuramoyl-L-alanyl-D-glutamate--2,6-diaminopimelate ligase [Steroidobacteraceae bacterium]|nr:UDP-N-acetylmuramoyl-L-alanyl-D-glutamate--2,6-diaminopimelate ligase [Steroidobacteraceae bacterium]
MSAQMPLDELLAGMAPAPPLPVSGLTLDSRAVAAGDAFVALKGGRGHGLEHAGDAAARGARAVLWDPGEGREPAAGPELPFVAVRSLRDRLGAIADRFYGMPSSRLTVAGVTGTNGKTTCAWLLASAAERLARRAAYLGTLGAGFPPAVERGELTTPDVITLHRQLRALADAGATHVAMEVSSHALDQRRLDAVRLRVAAFSNLTRDHLDYHGTMERYAGAKARLFRLPGLERAVINVGDPVGARFAAELPAGVELTAVAVGGEAPAAARFVHVGRVRAAGRGLELDIRGHFGDRRLSSPLIGAFNAENLAVTLGVLLAWQFDVDAALAALADCAAPPGRMEGYRLPNGALAVVDYAHTPDALAKALAATRAHARGRVVVVFGCGGERDPGKRALMGEAAERLADRVIVTDDNPRGENGDRIVAMILDGMREPARARVERDRGRAIDAAVAEAQPGDAVLVAGKGHEDYQLVGRERRAFSDRERLAARAGSAP